MELLDNQDQLDHQVHQDLKVHRVHRALKATLDLQDRLVHREVLAHQGQEVT
jgi:hypothetical protein